MNSGFRPKVDIPNLSNNIPQMKSDYKQVPFFFGGSQVPINTNIKRYNGIILDKVINPTKLNKLSPLKTIPFK